MPVLLCEFHERHPGLRISLEVHDTQTVVELVADRGLELGIVGAARRHRAVRFEPILEDEVILICPPGHPFAGRTVTVDELRSETLILMQEGAGVRQVVEDELRALGVRLRDLSISLELGLQESVRSAVQAGYGVTFISRTAVESDLAAGTVAEAHLEGMSAKREISLVRASGRTQTRAADAFVEFARERAVEASGGSAADWTAPTTRRRLTTPVTWPSSSSTGRWRKPRSSITRAASSTSVSAAAVIGSAVIHWRTRASLQCIRAAIALSRSRSVRIPIRVPKSLTTTAPTFMATIRSATSPRVSSGATSMKSGRMTSAIRGMTAILSKTLSADPKTP